MLSVFSPLGAPMERSRAAILIRLLVGVVFVLEGIKKFLFVDQWGAGRFTTIGIWHPGLTAPFVDGVEIVCGVLREMVWGCYALGEGLPAVGREPDFGARTNHEQHE